MPTYTTPGVYFEPTDQNGQGISALRTDIAAFIGIAQMGPLNVPTPVNTWEQFQSVFGNYIPNGYLAYCAKAFFDNGGQTLYGVRVAAPEAETATNPAAIQPADGFSSILLSTSGFAAGALATARQTVLGAASGVQPANGAASRLASASGFPQGSVVRIVQTVPSPVVNIRTVEAVVAATNTLYWDTPLDASFVLTQPIEFSAFQHCDLMVQSVNEGTNTVTWTSSLAGQFNLAASIEFGTGASTSRGELFDADGNPTIRLTALNPGVWGDSLSAFVALNNSAAATTSTVQPQPTTGLGSLLTSIVGFPVGTVVKAWQAGVAPQYRIVAGTDPTMNLLLWDTPLTAPLDFTKPISFESCEFTITVLLNGMEQEIFSGLSLDTRSAQYIETAISPATSRFVQATDLHSPASYPDRLPDPSVRQLNEGVLSLWGGRDGIAALTALQFTGDPSSETRLGLRSLEDVEQVSMVCAADILIEPVPAAMYAPAPPAKVNPCLPHTSMTTAPQYTPPPVEATPQFSLDDVFFVQQAIISHCEAMQYRVALLDPPDFGYPKQQVNLGEIQTWRNRFDSSYAALYFPWVYVSDPLLLNNQIVRRIPPSGHAAGVCAQTDLNVGVFKAPANVELLWAQDVTLAVTPNMQGFLNPLGINCIRSFRGRGLRIYGARTLSGDTNWRFLNVRRLMCMIEHALEIALQWAVFEPNNFYLWHKVRLAATTFLTSLWQQGAFTGSSADQAFFVNCDQLTNPAATTSVGQMLATIGVAPTVPAEFVVFRIGRTEDTLEIQEQS
jgi:phage tail sheath protein FI